MEKNVTPALNLVLDHSLALTWKNLSRAPVVSST